MRKHLSFSNVISMVALFAVIGGSAYAASSLSKNSVGSKQIQANAVKTKKIKDAAVTTPKLADNAVTGAKADESSFGKVPEAAKADSAATASQAAHASEAAHATEADNAAQLGGFDLSQVRPTSTTDSLNPSPDQNLGNNLDEVLETTVNIPDGGGTIAVQGSLRIFNPSAQARDVECVIYLGDAIEQIGQTIASTVQPTSRTEVPIVGQRTHLTPGGQGVSVSIHCEDASDGGLLDFASGDMITQVFPSD